MTDPISHMITSLKNASRAGKTTVVVPFSAMKEAVADCLVRHKFLDNVQKKTKAGLPFLELTLSYFAGKAVLSEVRRISKPSRRLYMGVRSIPTIKNGKGALILSTPKGILGDKEAKAGLVGGEVLFEVW